ncbi:MAG: B12-binding domain-containing radical SAM protein [Candidatus Omnitrophica bacterium]|nr:B12-binding domain-containing radical SAM protein [Candidatus Omnitrophota bacterium]
MPDIVLIKANNQKRLYQGLSEDVSAIEPPLWLILTAAYLRDKGFSVRVIDAEAENLDEQETAARALAAKPLFVSVIVSGTNPNASTCNMPGAGKVLAALKTLSPATPRAIAGLHPSALPEQTLREEAVDFVMVGEGFTTHAELLAALQNGKARQGSLGEGGQISDLPSGAAPDLFDSIRGGLARDFSIKGLWYLRGGKIVSNPRPDNIQDLGSLPMPAWDLLDMSRYRAHNWHCFGHLNERAPYAVVYTSLGCPFHCGFCCISAIFGGPGIRYRPTEKVLEEIDFLVKNYRVKNIKILDELFAMKWDHVEAICDGVIQRGYDLNFWVYGRIDTVKEYMLPKMKQAGINWIAYGIEAGTKKVRDAVSKGRFNEEDIKDIVRKTHAAGIEVVANFIFGLPDDDLESMRATLALAKELNCAYPNFYCAMAYPGSQLYLDAIREGWPLPQSWSSYAQLSRDCLPLPTQHLTSGAILKFRDAAFDDYCQDVRYLNRLRERFGEAEVAHMQKVCEKKLVRDNY